MKHVLNMCVTILWKFAGLHLEISHKSQTFECCSKTLYSRKLDMFQAITI